VLSLAAIFLFVRFSVYESKTQPSTSDRGVDSIKYESVIVSFHDNFVIVLKIIGRISQVPLMKRRLLAVRSLSYFFIAVAFFGLPAIANADCVLSVSYGTGKPFGYKNDNGEIVGMDIDILEATLADVGCKAEYVALPWKRTLGQIATGALDMTREASYKDERAEFAHYSVPYRGNPHVVVMGKDFPSKAADIEEFLEEGHSLGVVLGWHYTNKISALLKDDRYKDNVVVVQKFDILPEMFAKGRLDGFMANPTRIALLVGKDNLKQNYRMLPADVDILHFLLSKKSVSAVLAERFNDALEKRLRDGFFMEVCKRYEADLVATCDFLSLPDENQFLKTSQ
jgi:polar amino acid transport system substrate-binding protein